MSACACSGTASRSTSDRHAHPIRTMPCRTAAGLLVGMTAAVDGLTFLEVMIWIGIAFLYGFALVELSKSGAKGSTKAIWVLAILLLPIVGAVAYLLAGPSEAMHFKPLDKPEFNPQQTADMNYEMTHRPVG